MHGHEHFLQRKNNSAVLFRCCYITVNFAKAASQNGFSTFTPYGAAPLRISYWDQRQEYTEINIADLFFIVWVWERIEITSCAWAFTLLVYSSKKIFLSSSCWEKLLDNHLLYACLFYKFYCRTYSTYSVVTTTLAKIVANVQYIRNYPLCPAQAQIELFEKCNHVDIILWNYLFSWRLFQKTFLQFGEWGENDWFEPFFRKLIGYGVGHHLRLAALHLKEIFGSEWWIFLTFSLFQTKYYSRRMGARSLQALAAALIHNFAQTVWKCSRSQKTIFQ